MLIDWFTVIAQGINFLILVGVLKWLLYDRVVNAMRERQERIASKYDDAEQARQDAEDDAKQAKKQRQAIEQRRDDLLKEARSDADERRRELREQAEQDVQTLKERWIASVESDQRAFLDLLHRAAARSICHATERALKDLASARLDHELVEAFIERLANLDEDVRERLTQARQRSDESPRILSHAHLDEEDQQRLKEACGRIIGDEDLDLRFEREESLICGIRLDVSGQELSWSFDDHADRVVEAVERELDTWRQHEEPEEPSSPDDNGQASEHQETRSGRTSSESSPA